MRLTVRYFAILRDRTQCSEEVLEFNGKTTGDFVRFLIPNRNLGLPASQIKVAVNGAFVSENHGLADGDSVALIPPVAGG